jgi:hypothetical protein
MLSEKAVIYSGAHVAPPSWLLLAPSGSFWLLLARSLCPYAANVGRITRPAVFVLCVAPTEFKVVCIIEVGATLLIAKAV